ncbi:hypothetical protein VTK56DRAFT_3639 [Thermocarpiscus australiensis]
MEFDDLQDLFMKAKAQLEYHGRGVLTYQEYLQRYLRDSGAADSLAISNRFEELPNDQDNDSGSEAEAEEGDNDRVTDGFTEVNRSLEQQRSRLKKNEENSRTRCYWREYCRSGLDCEYGHTREEEERFKVYGSRTAKKCQLCRNADCTRGARCSFAHGEEELSCPTCGKTGAGHGIPTFRGDSRALASISLRLRSLGTSTTSALKVRF